jgi:protein SCO1
VNRRLLLLAVTALSGCAGSNEPLSPHGFVGAELNAPLPKPDLTFTDTHGQPYRFVQATAGKLTLLYFGYTHCPDICPVTMANLAAVLDRLPDEVQRKITVVFVTTDPDRDTPAVLGQWLGAFHAGFVGLTGPDSVLQAAQRVVRVLPAYKDTATVPGGKPGDYIVGHAAQVIAYTRDGQGRLEYPPDTRQRDWAHDLPLLVQFDTAQ